MKLGQDSLLQFKDVLGDKLTDKLTDLVSRVTFTPC